MVQPVDGYLLLSGGSQADIDAIVQGAQALGARKPCLVLSGSSFQALIPIDADSRAQFRQKVTQIVGGRSVNKVKFTVDCRHLPPGVHICPIKRTAFNPAVHVLEFALVTVPAAAGAVNAALAAIQGRGLTVSSIVAGSAIAQILVEVQETSQPAVDLSFARLGQVSGIGHQRLGAHLPGAAGPGIDPD